LLRLRPFAYDPDNRFYIPPERLPDGSLTPLEGTDPTVTYTVQGLPPGATFDFDTVTFAWMPDFTQSGQYEVTFTATDDGDGTGVPAQSSATMTVRVANTNRPPVLDPIANAAVMRGEVLEIPITATDADGNPIALSAMNALTGFELPGFVMFIDHGDGTGTLRVAPAFGDRGDLVVTISATDDGDVAGGGGPATIGRDEITFVISVESLNEPPVLAHFGDKVAVTGQTLRFNLNVSDPDAETLSFEMLNAPAGATLTPSAANDRLAVFEWSPDAGDLAGSPYAVTFRVTDTGNGLPGQVLSDQRTINIVVRQTNAAPVLLPIGDRTVTELDTLTIALAAVDSDGDALTYSVVNAPPGAMLDSVTGVFTYTPDLFAAGDYAVTFTVSDGLASSSESIEIHVENLNQPPVIVPLPIQSARENAPLQFTLSAGDIDGDPLAFFVVGGLPAGASFNIGTGAFHWTPGFDQAGVYGVTFGVRDPQGLVDQTTVQIRVDNVNRPPTLDVHSHQVAVGQTMAFVLLGDDRDAGTTLTYSVLGLPPGATLDPATGVFAWTPAADEAGDYIVAFTVSDGELTTKRSVLIRASLTPPEPAVSALLTPGFPAVPGQQVVINVVADSLAPIVARTVTIDGQPVSLDALHRALFTPAAPGVYVLEVTATDADGLVGTATSRLRVRDPADTAPPIVSLAMANAGPVSQPTDAIATVQDTNLDHWVLQRARLNDDQFATAATGMTAIDGEPIATIDPNKLANGLYVYRLTAMDISGRTSRTETIVEINSATKADHVTRAEVDLVLALGGEELAFTRFYDSLNRDRSGRFGFGWSLLGVDFDVQAGVTETGGESGGVFNPLRDGTRVYLTLPDGQRVGYTFTPIERSQGNVVWFTPAFTSDGGQSSMLASAQATLMRVGDRYYDLRTGRPYHPASGHFDGPDYTLALADGRVYLIDSQHGATRMIAPSGDQVFFGEQGVVTTAGPFATYVTDEANRIIAIADDHGAGVQYTYDDRGDLITARQQPAGQTTTYVYDASDAHLLVDASVSPAPAPAPARATLATLSVANQPVLPAGIPYYLDVIARTGDQGLVGFGDQPSINDLGQVAFVGQFVDGEGIFVGDHAGLENINPQFSHTLDRVFGRGVQINNSGQVLARDRVSGGPAIAHVRIWDGADFQVVASGGVRRSALFPNLFEDYAGVVSHGALNNHGQSVFGALTFDDPPDPYQFLSTLSGTIPSRRFNEFELRVGARPMMADTGEIVVRDDEGRIVLLPYNLSTFEVIADHSQFSELGRAPSISDDGRVIAFYGVLNAAGAAAQNYPQGPGIFASIKTSGGRILTRITGTQGDGQLDPGEAWNDANNNGVVDPGEDIGGLISFDHNTRIGVTGEFANNRGNITTAFIATSAAGEQGVFTTGLSYDFTTFDFTPVPLSTVVKVGQNVPGVGIITDVEINDPINNKGQVAVWVRAGSTQAIIRASEAHRPVLIVPGIGGTFPADGTSWNAWIVERGRHPDTLQLDTLSNAYDDLMTSFENLGYVQGKNLFGAVYDWRLDVGPQDGAFDGHISGLTASSISDEVFEYGVDYLGYFLKKAAEQWALDFPDEPPLDSVDLIVHSTGGLVARTYIQSDAYKGDAGGVTLPAVNNLFMIGVPNRGAAKAWNPIHNDWNVEPTFSFVLSKILYHAYRKVRNEALLDALTGENTVGISGPDYNIRTADIFGTNFTQLDVFNDKADFERFIALYNPTGRSLLATYPFLMTPGGTVTVNDSPEDRNNYMLDLNNGLDLTTNLSDLTVNDWVERIGRAFVMYGSDGETPVFAEQRVGPPSGLFENDDVLLPFTDFIASAPDDGQPWWEDIFVANSGDGTVPLASSRAQFQSDGRFTLFNATAAETGGPTGHVELTRNIGVQRFIFDALGLRHTDVDISTQLGASPNVGNVLSALIDPVEAIIVDGQGRRVGFSSAEGVFAEIPGSKYAGDTDGFVLITGSAVNQPFTLELTGLGGDYYIKIGISTDTHIGGVEAEGFLAKGQKRSIEVPVWERTNDRPTAVNDSATTDEDTPVIIDVLGNDVDRDGTLDPTTLQIVNAPINGSATVTSGGMIAYTPGRDFYGTDFFTYTVRDDGGAVANKAFVTVQVLPVNDPPVANNDTANAREGGDPIVIDVLANDTDVDDLIDPTTVVVETGPQHGSVQIDPVTGEITYTPGATFLGDGLGSDTFTYTVADLAGDRSLPATVLIHINRRPTARDDVAFTDEDTPVTIHVLANDSDIDGFVLARSVMLSAAPDHGTARVNRDGTITYTPQPDFSGTDALQYTVRDDTNGVSLPATVTIHIAAVNDAPQARDDIAFTVAGVPVQITVLLNDTDVDGQIDPASVTLATPPAHGSVSIGLDGTITYTPDADFTMDSFTYTVRDELGAYSNAARVTVTLPPPDFIRNGGFNIDDPAAPGFGWSILGDVRVVNGQAMLGESSSLIARLTQSFTVPDDALALHFTIEQAFLNAAPGALVDAFEVALLDAMTFTPVASVVDTLDASDALINMQPDGGLHVGPAVNVSFASGMATGPMQVEIDLAGLNGRALTLYFDLLGAAGPDSVVVIDDVHFRLAGPGDPSLSVQLAPEFDTGVAGDNLTRLTSVDLIGSTDPGLPVFLDVDGDGLDNAQVTADVNGLYRFSAIGLAEGTNTLRVRVSNEEGTTTRSIVVELDSAPPVAVLIDPLPGQLTNSDPGYVDVQWTDLGIADLDPTTFGVADVTITGVTVDSFTDLGGGLVRYIYSGGGDSLLEGTVQVQIVAGAVADLAGNTNAAAVFSFVIDHQGPIGMLIDPAPGSTISVDVGYVEIQWLDLGLAGLDHASFGTGDVTVTGVSIDRVQDLGDGLVRYWYNDDGDVLPAGMIVVSLPAGAVSDLAGNPSESATASFTMATADEPVDVTALVTVQYFGVQYNRRTGVWAFYGQVTNLSDVPLSAPIRVLWADLEPAGSTVVNADGTLADGTPYFEIDAENGVLEPGETSTVRTFALQTPSRIQYSFTTIVTAMLPPGSGSLTDGTSHEGGNLTAVPTIYPYHNYEHPYDVSGNGILEPLDVLIVVNYVNANGPGLLPEPAEPPLYFPDVNADGAVTAQDVLILINALNAGVQAVGEGEAVPTVAAAALADTQSGPAETGLRVAATFTVTTGRSPVVPEPAAAAAMRHQVVRDVVSERPAWDAPDEEDSLWADVFRRTKPKEAPLTSDRFFQKLQSYPFGITDELDEEALLDDLAADIVRWYK
jgi:YD repeat-containing protein